MGVFDNLERKLEGVVNGAFARAFKGDVQPVEITARLQKELDAEARLLARDRKMVPNEFVIGLSRHDYDRLVPYTRTLNSDIIPQLREYAASAGYVFNGPVTLAYELDEQLPVGRFTVVSEAVAAAASSATATAIRRASLVLEVNGIRHPLSAPGFTLGRGTDADVRINDPGISRLHARINVSGNGDQPSVTIEDMGSTNGILVDGQRVRQAALRDGSRVELGSTRMLVRSPVSDV
ncbi:MAG: FHA domain-containing protein [Nigerium sp.]|nr:FHA domain-containing protein [Nigerium sp.]